MLKIIDVTTHYGPIRALHNISIQIDSEEIVCLLGGNASGKSTTMKTILGIVKPTSGQVKFNGERIDFIHRKNHDYDFEVEMEQTFHLFPRLSERLNQDAGTLSGGEQQMLAIGRALMAKPKMIIMDEPSMGLSPKLVDEVFGIILQVRQVGIPIFVVEQNLKKALSIADRGYILNRGQIVLQDSAENLLQNENVIKAYLGEG